MVFSSVIFLVYFLPLFLLVYHLVPRQFKNPVVLLSSIFFYAWGAPKFIFVILGTTTLDFFLVRSMYFASEERKKKLLLILSLTLNVGLLFYFKYCNFFISNINYVLAKAGAGTLPWLEVVLPIGISFYTFESITYVVDVYRRVHKPLSNFWEYQLYIILFPKLIAGPIVRYHDIADQIRGRFDKSSADQILSGFYRFVIGLAKKMLIANTMAVQADLAFNTPVQQLGTGMAWLGMLAYTFQIYFDFSGYSDMAIGIGKMIGFRFPENFDNPYTSKSITEFWRRWHMTLGSWMKNYLYIPLGGNQVNSRMRLYFNLWLVFIASGFWHGASWTFIAWGVYHGLWLVLERAFLSQCYRRMGSALSHMICFLLVAVGWVLFRSPDLSHALRYLQKLIALDDLSLSAFSDREFVCFFILAFLFSFFTLSEKGKKIQAYVYEGNYSLGTNVLFMAAGFMLFAIALASVTASSFNPFIYFRF